MSTPLKWVAGVVVVAAAGAFAYWTISPFFISVKVDEALPAANEENAGQMAPEAPMSEPAPSTETTEAAAPAAVVGTAGHPASGSARIVEAGGTTYVRYENFKTLNGPDLYVYLAKDLEASDFVDLGRLKATEGNINYAVPAGVNAAEYPYVLVWCKAFGVLFNFAKVH